MIEICFRYLVFVNSNYWCGPNDSFDNCSALQFTEIFIYLVQSENKTLAMATIVTSPTTEKITKSEVKVSGSCQFNTTLPPEEGKYSFYVSVSPGGQSFSVEDNLFTVGNLLFLCLFSYNLPYLYKYYTHKKKYLQGNADVWLD